MENSYLTTTDFILVVIYLLVLLAIGYRASRNQGVESFLIAGRKLEILSAVATINASKTGSIVIIFTALIYAYGMSAIWYFVGMSLGYLLFLPFALKLYRSSSGKYYTLADYYHYNYGGRAAGFASLACIIAMFGLMILNLIAAAKVLVFFTGIAYAIAAWIVGAVVLLYLLCAGFKAVVSTDLFQYLAILAILFLFFAILYGDVPIPATEYDLGKADAGNLLGFFLLGILLPFAQPELWQRVYAVKDEILLRKSILISIAIHFLFALVLALVGLSIKAALPDIAADTALIEGFARLLPPGLTGLAVVIFFSAMMSSVDTYAYTASSCIVQDFFKQASGERVVWLIRCSLAGTVLSGTVISIAYNDLVGAAFVLSGFLILVSIPTLLTWVRPETDKSVFNIALPVSITGMALLVASELFFGTLGPTLMLKAIALSTLSLFIGYMVSKMQKKQAA